MTSRFSPGPFRETFWLHQLTWQRRGPRKILFVPLEKRDIVDKLLGPRQILLHETSGKALLTDRPLDRSAPQAQAQPTFGYF